MAKKYALFASALYHDHVVEERVLRPGAPVQIGNSRLLSVPVPEGYPYVARVQWSGADRCEVVDGAGRAYVLDPSADLVIEVGAVTLRLALVEQYAFKRAQPLGLRDMAAWFTIVLMSSVLSMQALWVHERRCAISTVLIGPTATAQLLPRCFGHEDTAGGVGVTVTAEYLARLLKEDYAGDEQGVMERELERPDAERKVDTRDKPDQFYIPAGSEGPITNMGGAEDRAPEPVRTRPEDDEFEVPVRREEATAPLFAEQGTPIELPEVTGDEDAIAEAGIVEEETPNDRPEPEPPAEEEIGWGVPDWYDEQDEALEELEIEIMLRAAKQRLAIDPNDPSALSVLSYYQYLAEDYDAAMKTYDKYIELYADEAPGYNNKALVYKRLADYEKEEGLYRVALSLEPLDVTAMNNLAVNLAHQGRYDEALALMEQLEVLDPGDPYADLHRSKIHAEMGNEERALHYLEEALKGMERLDTLHHIEFRQDIRIDPSFAKLRQSYRFRAILSQYYGKDTPLQE